MSNSGATNQDSFKFSGIDFTSISGSWVYKLNKDSLICELARRNLKSTVLVTELRTRLLKYSKEETEQNGFELETIQY